VLDGTIFISRDRLTTDVLACGFVYKCIGLDIMSFQFSIKAYVRELTLPSCSTRAQSSLFNYYRSFTRGGRDMDIIRLKLKQLEVGRIRRAAYASDFLAKHEPQPSTFLTYFVQKHYYRTTHSTSIELRTDGQLDNVLPPAPFNR